MLDRDPRLTSPEYKKLSPEQKAMVKLEITLTNFFRDFNQSITRWERVVYPMVVVLAFLVISGFYLIYHVTNDMHAMMVRIDPNMETNLESMSKNMSILSTNISAMTQNMQGIAMKMESMDTNIASMNGNIGTLSESVGHMNKNMEVMTYTVSDMNQVMKVMSINTGNMSRDIHQIQRPMNFMP
jgi:methyl-accepting chemotaxis protein